MPEVEVIVHELPESKSLAWSRTFESDYVAGGTEYFTLGRTGLMISHWRGFFHVFFNGKCQGGIELVFGISPKQYFLANQIPLQGTLAKAELNRSRCLKTPASTPVPGQSRPEETPAVVVHELPEAVGPTWIYSRSYDHVVGGIEYFTLGETGLKISHYRGFFKVWFNDKTKPQGSIEDVFGVTPTQYFLANQIPYQGTLAESQLHNDLFPLLPGTAIGAFHRAGLYIQHSLSIQRS